MKKTVAYGILLFLFCMSLPFQQLRAEERVISLQDAILKTLESNPGIKVQAAKVDQSKGVVQTAEGQFDWVGIGTLSKEIDRTPLTSEQEEEASLAASVTGNPLTEDLREETTTYGAGIAKQFRTGITMTPSVSAVNYYDNTSQLDPLTYSDLNVEFVIPLLKGLGTESAGAEEMAAKSGLHTTELALTHKISGSIYTTAASYWKCLAAKRNLEILEDKEKRGRDLFQTVELLIRAGELEPALLNQARAKLLLTQSNLADARLALYETRQTLALAMGLSSEELSRAPLVEGTYPRVIEPETFRIIRQEQFIREAFIRRADYLAAKADINTEEILFRKSQKDTKPRLDFNVKLGYAGLDENNDSSRYYNTFSHKLTGPNVLGTLSLELPIKNNAARGEMFRRKSLVKEKELVAEELSDNIASQVLVAMEKLRSAILEYQRAKESAEAYKKVVAHETFKLKEGESSLSDLIDSEDRYYQSRIAENNAISKYAIALANLRFVTGTILEKADERGIEVRVRPQTMLEFPVFD